MAKNVIILRNYGSLVKGQKFEVEESVADFLIGNNVAKLTDCGGDCDECEDCKGKKKKKAPAKTKSTKTKKTPTKK